jgi:Fe2+ or Zn2+ uptake regulation protein
MSEMVFAGLASRTRLDILKILSNGSKTVKDVINELNSQKYNIKYRESVYRSIEKLKEIGLIEKYYDEKNKSIMYRMKVKKIVYEIDKDKIQLII